MIQKISIIRTRNPRRTRIPRRRKKLQILSCKEMCNGAEKKYRESAYPTNCSDLIAHFWNSKVSRNSMFNASNSSDQYLIPKKLVNHSKDSIEIYDTGLITPMIFFCWDHWNPVVMKFTTIHAFKRSKSRFQHLSRNIDVGSFALVVSRMILLRAKFWSCFLV